MNRIEEATPNNSGLSQRVFVSVFGFLMIASLVPIWIGKYFPSQNGPEYLLAVQMVKEYFNPAFNYSEYYDLIPLVVPNMLFHVVEYLLSFIFPLLVASKIVLSISVILLPLSAFYVIKAIDAKKTLFGFVSFTFIFNYFMHRGYSSFYISIPIFFFFWGYLVKHLNRLDLKDLAWLSVLGFLIYISHVFSFLLAVFLATVYILLRGYGYQKLLKVLATFIPSLIFFVQFVTFIAVQRDSLVKSASDEGTSSWIRYLPLLDRVKDFIKMSMYSFSSLTALVFLIPLSFTCYLIIKRLFRLRRDFSVSRTGDGGLRLLMRGETTLFLLAILSLLFFVLPYEIAGWPKFNVRLLPFVFIFMLVCAEPFSKKMLNRMFLGGVSTASLLLYAIMIFHIVKINTDLKDYTSGIPVIEKNRTLLPVHLEDYHIGKIRPLQWAFNYYNVFKGGATGRSVVKYTGRIPMKYKRPVEDVFPSFEPDAPENADMVRIKEAYDYVLFWGVNREIFDLFEKNGFKLIHEQGKLRLYSNSTG